MPSYELRGGKDLARIVRELRKASDGKELVKQYRKELRAAAKPLVPAVRASIRAIPAASGQHTGLRQRMAKATTLTVKTSARRAQIAVRVDGRKMPAGEGSLPAYMDGRKRPWRHPVYGNTRVWVRQDPHPYFDRAIAPLAPLSRLAIRRATDAVTKQIT